MSKTKSKSKSRGKADASNILSTLSDKVPTHEKPAEQQDESRPGTAMTGIEPGAVEPFTAVTVVQHDIPDDAPMTETERADYQRYMASIKTRCIETAKMILEIRRRKLYREEFKTFDEWVAYIFGKTRQWVTGLNNWVRRQELTESFAKDGGPLALPFNGKPAYQIIPKEAEALGPLEDHPEEFCRALVEATDLCRRNPKRRRTKVLEEMVKTQEAYLRRKHDVPDLTYEEFRAINSVGWHGRIDDEFVAEVNAIKSQGGDWMGRLVEAVQQGDLSSEILLGCARGQELIDLCIKLKVQKDRRESLREAEKEAKQATAKLERTRAEIAKCQEEAAAKSQDEGKVAQPEDAEAEEERQDDEQEEEVEQELPVFEVAFTGSFEGIPGALHDSIQRLLEDWKPNLFRWNLTMDSAIIVKPVLDHSSNAWAKDKLVSAKQLLEAALEMMGDVCTHLQTTWEEPGEHSELVAVIVAAQDCEMKLGEIAAKAKELLADAEEPEEVPSGND